MSQFNAGWYVIYTKPKHEKKVAAELKFANIGYYMPMTKVLRSWHDRKKYVDLPLFPSYIFVRLTNLEDYYFTLAADGAIQYVKFGKEVARVSDTVIESIRQIMGSGSEIEVSTHYFPPGQQLVICQGPFTGVNCEVVQVDKKDKILVRISLLQRSLVVSLSPGWLLSAAS